MNVKVDFIKQEQALEPEFKEMQPVPGGNQPYTLPVATPEILGGVKPVAKTEGMTQSVGVDETGGLWTKPSDDVGDVETALDTIIAIQNELIGGDAE